VDGNPEQSVPQHVIPAKSNDLVWALTKIVGCVQESRKILKLLIKIFFLDSANASLRARISSRYGANFVRNEGFLQVIDRLLKDCATGQKRYSM
jgi:hypothetical protein